MDKFKWQAIAVILSVVASVAYGKESSDVNFFNLDETVWISGVEYTNPSMQDVVKSGLYVLGDIERIENKDARVISSYYYDDPDGTKLGSYTVYSDGDKVYFLNPESSEWLLLYDFSLSPGEGVEIWECTLGYIPAKKPVRLFAYCEDQSHLQSNQDLCVMHIKFYSSEEEFNMNPDCPVGESRWIVGLGSMSGPISNVDYFGVGGDCSYLSMVYSKGTIIYQSATADIKENLVFDRIRLSISDGTVTVRGNSVSDLKLIDINGKVYQGIDGFFYEMPSGIYIAIGDGYMQKIYIP